jgi:hypothetical protein
MVGPAKVRGIMAPKTRSSRTKQPPKRPGSGVAARNRRKRAAIPGMVETALAAFAHEVRTPLTGILAISDLLATSDLDERERRWVDTIKAGAEHLASLATLFSICGRWRATPAIRLPAGRQRRVCNPKSIFQRSFPRSWSAIPFACVRPWKT